MPEAKTACKDREEAKSQLAGRFVRFVLIGAFSSLLYVLFVIFLVEIAGISDTAAVVASYLCVIPLNFVLHRKVTFQSQGDVRREVTRFLFVHTCNVFLSLGAMEVTTTVIRLPYWVGAFSAAAIITLSSFILMQIWVFFERRP